MDNIKKQIKEYIDKNLTDDTIKVLADKLQNSIIMVFTAPYDIALNLIEIIQNKKYLKYIIAIWSVISGIALALSFVLTVLNNSFPLNAWALGVSIASFVIILLEKHPVKIKVNSNLSKEIQEVINRDIPTIDDLYNTDDYISDLIENESEDNDDEELDTIDEYDEELETIDEDDDEIDNFNSDDFNDILDDIMSELGDSIDTDLL